MKVLHVDSSINGAKSVTNQLSAGIVSRLKASHPEIQVTYYDLNQNPLPYLSSATFAAMGKDEADRNDAEKTELAAAGKALEDFMSADVVVLGAPMYNFSVPTQLRGFLDRLAVAGKTFRYTANGPEGLSGGKRVIVASGRGGVYSQPEAMQALDHQESYLKTFFAFLGIQEVEIIRAEGVALGPDHAEKALAAAREQIQQIA